MIPNLQQLGSLFLQRHVDVVYHCNPFEDNDDSIAKTNWSIVVSSQIVHYQMIY